MSSKKTPVPTPKQVQELKVKLDAILDFGPAHPPSSQELSHNLDERLRRLVKQLQEMSQRIDLLASRF